MLVDAKIGKDDCRDGSKGGGDAPLKLEKYDFFSHEIPQTFSRLPPLGAILLKYAP